MSDFVCKQCGQCCFEIPCVFAQAEHGLKPNDGKVCPELVQIENNKYKCLAIERNGEVREALVGNGCDKYSERENKPTFNAGDIVREYFPEADGDHIKFILWNNTSFPEFWNIPIDGWTAKQCLRTELRRVKYGKVKNKVGE